MKNSIFVTLILLATTGRATAKVDLVTLPTRDAVQLTIYNSADMTLVRERRDLTLKKGLNKLQFSWTDTLIDPTSLEMVAQAHAEQIDILDLTFPPRVKNLGLWHIHSEVSGQVPVEITYLTSGFTWRAFYMGTLTADENTMRLQGYIRVTNNSGEPYENAQTRLIVGKVHILDQIAELAARENPFGRPDEEQKLIVQGLRTGRTRRGSQEMLDSLIKAEAEKPKGIEKEGLSEYFLYTIEGTESIPHGWSKRLPSFNVGEVPVLNLYKYEEERYGPSVVRFLSFQNDEQHQLGETPIPGGDLKVYRDVGPEQHLSYEGQSSFKYVPVEEDVELNLGPVGDVVVQPTLMDFKTDQYLFDDHRDVSGWDEIRQLKMEVKNTRSVPVKVVIQRNFPTQHWTLKRSGDSGEYEKVDLDTVKFTLELASNSQQEFVYVLTTRHGRRTD